MILNNHSEITIEPYEFARKRHLPNLNALRCVLAILVVLDHTAGLSKNQGLVHIADFSIINKSTEAVYAFFVLSGFLIVRTISFEKKEGTFSVKNFYVRRALRILPLYYVIGLFGLFFYHFWIETLGIEFNNEYSFQEGLLMIGAMAPNVLFTFSPGGILEVLWSIGIEEQFYLGIAPLILITKSKNLLKGLASIFILSFLFFHIPQISFFRNYGMVYFFLLSGGLVAISFETGRLNFLLKSRSIQTTIFVGVFLVFFTDFIRSSNLMIYHLTLLLLFSIFIQIISDPTSHFIIKNRFINYLGKISYGIYMLHTIVLNLIVFIFLEYSIGSALVTVILINGLTISITFFISHLSYKYFESYFLKKKERFRITLNSSN